MGALAQLAFWPEEHIEMDAESAASQELAAIDPMSFDYIVLAYSGGKDCTSAFLHLLDLGVPKSKIELWHHIIDGREGSTLMDWPVTEDYCVKFAEAFSVPIYMSWKINGFEGEMNRAGTLTAPTSFETPDGVQTSGGIRGALGTRRKFPQQAASLTVRWCSSYGKIDVCSKAISGQKRFDGKRVLLVTGERAEESPGRACYKAVENHRTSTKGRTVVQWRPVHQWKEAQVWEILERYKVNPHPCYHIGMSRCSCSCCIFSSVDQWATMAQINPKQVERIADYEDEFGVTINRKRSVREMVAVGKPYEGMGEEHIRMALSREYTASIILEDTEWRLPNGAFGEGGGPI